MELSWSAFRAREEREALFPKVEFLVGFVFGLGVLGGVALSGVTHSIGLLVTLAAVLVLGGLATDLVLPRWRHFGVGIATGITGAAIGLVGGVLLLVWAFSAVHFG